jgi:hypothetical protein
VGLRRIAKGNGQVNAIGPIRDGRKNTTLAVEFFKINIEKLRGPTDHAHLHKITTEDGEIGLVLIPQIVRLVIGQEVGKDGHRKKHCNHIESYNRKIIVLELPPDKGPVTLT